MFHLRWFHPHMYPASLYCNFNSTVVKHAYQQVILHTYWEMCCQYWKGYPLIPHHRVQMSWYLASQCLYLGFTLGTYGWPIQAVYVW